MSISRSPCLAIVIAGLFTTACDGTELTRFNVDEELPETRVDGVGVVGVLPTEFAAILVDVTQSDAYNEEDFDHVTSIRVTNLRLDISEASEGTGEDALEDGQPDNFDFFQSLDLVILATYDGADREERIAYLAGDDTQVGSSATSLNLTTTNIDIQPFVEAPGGYTIQTQATGSAPPDDVVFDGEIRYQVGVGF